MNFGVPRRTNITARMTNVLLLGVGFRASIFQRCKYYGSIIRLKHNSYENYFTMAAD